MLTCISVRAPSPANYRCIAQAMRGVKAMAMNGPGTGVWVPGPRPSGWSTKHPGCQVQTHPESDDGHDGDEGHEGDEVSSIDRNQGVGAGAAAFGLVNQAPRLLITDAT